MKARTETELVKACLAVCESFGVFAWRNNTGAAKIGNRFIRFGVTGSPDILGVLPGGRLLAVECKVKGNKLSASQEAFLDRLERSGAFVAVIEDDVDDLIFVLKTELKK